MSAPILEATRRRSAALVARDADALRALHHPGFRFTTPRGDVRDRDAYILGNTAGEPGAHDMRLTLVWVLENDQWVVLAAHAGPAV